MSDNNFAKTLFLYRGVRLGSNGKLFCVYEVLDGEFKGEKPTFTKNKNTDNIPGYVYSVDYNGTTAKNGFNMEYRHSDEQDYLDIVTMDKRDRDLDKLNKKDAKMKRENDTIIRDCLRPLSEAYHSTNASGRAVLLAQIINYVQKEL